MTQDEVAALSGAGAEQRSQFAHLETKRSTTPLRSRDMVKRLATAFAISSDEVEALYEGRMLPETAHQIGRDAVADRLTSLRAQKQKIPDELQEAIAEVHEEGLRSVVAETWCKDQARHGVRCTRQEWAEELRRVDRMHRATIREHRRR